eukprot:scaffold135508_cov33-Tisochrysis_lutea.AAC.3
MGSLTESSREQIGSNWMRCGGHSRARMGVNVNDVVAGTYEVMKANAPRSLTKVQSENGDGRGSVGEGG